MTFEQVLEAVTTSYKDDWWTDACWGERSAPSYHSRPEFEKENEGSKVMTARSHSNVAAYKPDVSITIAWGLDCLEDFKSDWANKFAEPRASSSYLDIFYNNALVFREGFVTVDGGRARLPFPRLKWDSSGKKVVAMTVPKGYRDLIKVLDSLERKSDFDSYFAEAGFIVVDEAWPT